jgi:hypothetical protein
MNRYSRLLMATVANVAIIVPTEAQDTSSPKEYAKLYTAVGDDVAAFAAAAPSCPNNTTHPLVVAEIGGADANFLQRALPQATPARMAAMVKNAVNEAKLLQQQFGIRGVETSMSYPILVDNPANIPNNGTLTTAYFDKYMQFYEQFAAGVHSLGLKLIVESNINLPGQDAGAFTYKGITLAQLQAGMTEVTQHILDNVHPDVLEIFSEPSTLSHNTGLTELMTPKVYAQFIVGMRQAYDTTNSPRTIFSAGSADWVSQKFLVELVAADAAAPIHLDIFDLHAYPPDDLAAAVSDMNYLIGQGKTISMSETWDNKISAAAPIALPKGWTSPDLQQVLNGYSFWQSIDAQYLPAMYAYLDCRGAAYVNYWHSPQFWSYVGYNAATAAYDSNQMKAALDQAYKKAAKSNTMSPSGAAMQALIAASSK